MRKYTESERRAAENRIKIDMDRLNLVGGGQGRSPDEVKASAGSGLAILIVCIVAVILAPFVFPGCATISGIGRDLTAVSEGVRAEMAKEER